MRRPNSHQPPTTTLHTLCCPHASHMHRALVQSERQPCNCRTPVHLCACCIANNQHPTGASAAVTGTVPPCSRACRPPCYLQTYQCVAFCCRQFLVLSMVPNTTDAGQLPTATARACLPYWLEAGGWAAALQADAVAAAMGRGPTAQRQQGSPRSFIEQQVRLVWPIYFLVHLHVSSTQLHCQMLTRRNSTALTLVLGCVRAGIAVAGTPPVSRCKQAVEQRASVCGPGWNGSPFVLTDSRCSSMRTPRAALPSGDSSRIARAGCGTCLPPGSRKRLPGASRRLWCVAGLQTFWVPQEGVSRAAELWALLSSGMIIATYRCRQVRFTRVAREPLTSVLLLRQPEPSCTVPPLLN